MYTRLTTFPVKENTTDQAIEIGKTYGKILHDLPGHVSTVMFPGGDTIYSITTWDTEEHAQAVQNIRDDAQRDMGDLLAGAPSTTITETTVHDVS